MPASQSISSSNRLLEDGHRICLTISTGCTSLLGAITFLAETLLTSVKKRASHAAFYTIFTPDFPPFSTCLLVWTNRSSRADLLITYTLWQGHGRMRSLVEKLLCSVISCFHVASCSLQLGISVPDGAGTVVCAVPHLPMLVQRLNGTRNRQ